MGTGGISFEYNNTFGNARRLPGCRRINPRGFLGCMDHPTCDGEHLLVHKLRSSPAFVPELDFVAETEGQLVGSVVYSRSKVVAGDGRETKVLTFGPLSVLPAYKRMWILPLGWGY